MKRIAITGSMGSGKSTLSQILRKLGYLVSDADAIAREILQSDQTKKALIKRYGSIVINADHSVNKTYLASRIFTDIDDKAHLEALIHPQVYAYLANIKGDDLIFAEVPLLFESKGEQYFDEVWVVATEEALLRERLKQSRDYSDQMIDERLMHQMSQAEKIKRADVVFVNDHNIATLEAEIKKVLKRYEPTSTG